MEPEKDSGRTDNSVDPIPQEESENQSLELSHGLGEETVVDGPDDLKKKKKKDGLGTSRGVETVFRTSYRVHMELSSLADAKANIMISINGIIISVIIAAISPKIDSNPWLLLPTSFLLLGSLISIVYAVRSARPRVSSKLITLEDVKNNTANLLFFGHFSRMNEEDFVLGMSQLLSNQTALYQNMIRDIYGLGRVLTRKFELLRISYAVFMVGLIVGILGFITVYVWIVFTLGPQ